MTTEKNFPKIARVYAREVVAGKIPACKWTVAACERFLHDLARQTDKGWPYKFDEDQAQLRCYTKQLFPHIKGKWAGTRIEFEPWQCFIDCNIFGWVHKKTGLRRFRTAYIEVPRKNAKSTYSSTVALDMTFLDGEGGAEGYSAATTRDQAAIVAKDARLMAKKSPDFLQEFGVDVLAQAIVQEETGSVFRPLSAEANSLDGLNVHCGIIDELHAHKTREVFDVIETATGSRTQSLLLLITTAGSNRAGICYEQRTYLTKILDGVVEDDTYFGIIYTIDDKDDWTDPTVWAKANPNFGVSVLPEDIARLCTKAQQMPSAQNNFLTKRLNVWVNADSAWMDMRAWERCADPTLDFEQFAGQECFVGLDLASKIDIAAKMFVFPFMVDGVRHYAVFGRYYLPEAAIEDGRNSQYAGWEIEKRLISTPGDVLDFDLFQNDLVADSKFVNIVDVAFDPWQATQLAQNLQDEGLNMVEYRQTVANFSEPMKELDALVRAGRLHTDGDPILTWMVSNVVCHVDAKENIYPRKERPENKIDGVVALISALGRAIMSDDGVSIYEQRGLTEF